MSDRVCVRGCTQRDVHWATCAWFGINDEQVNAVAPCKGCAPRECRDGSLICDQCWGRARGLLSDAPDLLGRLRSLGDPSKSGWNWQQLVIAGSGDSADRVHADLLDATHAVEAAIRFFGSDITEMANDMFAMKWLGTLVLDRHTPDRDGVREGWSVRDAVDRWGVERRDDHRHVFPGRLPNAPEGSYARFDDEEEPVAVTGWYDPPLTVAQAATARGVSQQAVRKWVQKGLIPEGMLMRSRGARGSTLTATFASLWYAIHPCPIVHDGEWCTRVDGHDGACSLTPGTRPTNHLIRTEEDR